MMKKVFLYLLMLAAMPVVNCSDVPEYNSADEMLPCGTISINSGDFYSQSNDVILDLNVSNAEEMCFSTDGITYTAWEPYGTGSSITLPSGHGIKTVYGSFRNAGGEATVTDTIISLAEQKIVASDGTANSYFGGGNWSHTTANLVFSYDGNTMITSSAVANKVYIYKRNGGSWGQAIITSPETGATFGQSVACTPDAGYLVVGAMSKACIYIYRLSGSVYSLENTISAPPPIQTNDYAVTVSISDDGDRILAGSWSYSGGIGRAYIYQRTGTSWATYTPHIFENTGGLTSDRYGLGVKISGDGNTAAVSAIGKTSMRGSIYIYRWSGTVWTGDEYMTSDGVSGDMLGRHIGMSYDGSRIIVGTRCWQGGNHNQGAAYLFEWSGSDYVETYKFTASDGAPDDLFGLSVSMTSDGNTVVIGSPMAYGATVKGRAYIFTCADSVWEQEAILSASDGAAGDFYGNITAVSGDGSVIAISAPLDTVGSNSQQGSVYLYY